MITKDIIDFNTEANINKFKKVCIRVTKLDTNILLDSNTNINKLNENLFKG